MTIALDAMGGDHAPAEVVAGALQAAPLIEGTILLVGDPDQIKKYLPHTMPTNVHIHPASEVIGMEEKPLDALRKKKNSSLSVGIELVKSGQAEAFVSAGNTGAATAGCLLGWRPMTGIHRPAIASILPNQNGGFLLLDAGASPDVDPENLVEFAIMGRAYMERVMRRLNPTVHLLNIGEEEGKGNAFAKEAYTELAKYDWFKGNIEGKDMYAKEPDVVVCDAFVGNIVLKTSEGVAELILDMIKQNVPTNPIARLACLPLKGILAPLKKKVDYAEIGGSPLLGLNGICIICHGRSNAKAIKNALLQAQMAAQRQLVQTIQEGLEGLR